MTERIFVLGGTRSGKSRYARERARAIGGDQVSFVATARPGDPELDARIAAHRADRPAGWETIDADRDLQGAIARARQANVLLIDSLTLWVSAALERDGSVRDLWATAQDALDRRGGAVLVVSDEVGLGIVPANASARTFRDELCWLHQVVAAWSDEVLFVVAGLATHLKGGR